MKTKFPPSKKKTALVAYFGGAIGIFLILLLIFSPSLNQPLVRLGLEATKPFLLSKIKMEKWFRINSAVFHEKKELIKELDVLKEKTGQLEAALLEGESLKQENKNILSLVNRKQERNYVLAAVLFKPPQVFYDSLVIDAGINQGLAPGMAVTAYGNILLGYVSDVSSSASKVKLISSLNEETNAVFQDSGLSVVALGKGGENFEISLPRSVEVKIGETITNLEINPLLVGIVERIEKNDASPFQKIFFRLPLNLNYLRYVLVIKS
ncbi:MAG: hypothetical protein UU71_C0025G0010 [Parcubacteria group bacterium GW2011_GWB1_41_6]|nr:MAG: hypothetical protein UU71_C0025G0010 [Parcubacteria group bacterium GW2011_GWB1_41_6]KKS33898.1 MAG: hypothetical protein UU96_C0012G0013 [Parcubacteria group bacterium GW2011_GWC2_42_13]KKS58121.1 MAG: hypothetical protein UV22_C0005G0010 [Parcubacteria group bacterium GW2011_GWA2_42_35]